MNKVKDEDVDMERGTKRPITFSGDKHPTMLLNEIRPGVKFNYVNEQEGPNAANFIMSVIVDGKTYSGTGRSKQIAKALAADAALKGIGLVSATKEDIVVAKKQKQNLVSKPQNDASEITLMHLYGDSIKFENLDETVGSCKVCLNIEGSIIEGTGHSLKAAKAAATEKGMTFLKEMGLYNKRVNEYHARLAAKKLKKAEYFKQKKLEKKAAKMDVSSESLHQAPPVQSNKPLLQKPAPSNIKPQGGKVKPKNKGTKL